MPRQGWDDEEGLCAEKIQHFFSSDAAQAQDFSPGSFPLLSRGWVFQERLLSPRILHLEDVEMAWECNETTACDCMGETKTYESEPRWTHTKGSHIRNSNSANEERDVQPEWRSTVVNYKKTSLTFEKDIFPAVSGVVKKMQRYRSDRYLAGVWEGSLHDDLAWQSTNCLLSRPFSWRAPTWSWASVAPGIRYNNMRTNLAQKYLEDMEPLTSLIEASITPAGPDATGELLSDHLVLFEPMVSARLEYSDKNPEQYFGIESERGNEVDSNIF
jgi:hypothetical protein